MTLLGANVSQANAFAAAGQHLPTTEEDVTTVGSAMLLVTTQDAPAAEVARVSDFVFNRMPQMGVPIVEVVGASAAHELRGVTIPLHPGVGQKSQ